MYDQYRTQPHFAIQLDAPVLSKFWVLTKTSLLKIMAEHL